MDLDLIRIDPKSFLREHCKLLVLPEMITPIQGAIRDENVDLEKIAGLIKSDPGLHAQVLDVVNSAYYALPREVHRTRVAIAYLGPDEVCRIALSLSVVKSIGVKEKDVLDTFRRHAFYTAICARYVAVKHEPHLPHDEIWIAALLHDVGKLVYTRFYPDHFNAVGDYRRKEGVLTHVAEEHFGLPSSGYFGVLLSDHWKLPASVRLACEKHTIPDLLALDEADPNASFLRVVSLGTLVASLASEDLSEESREIGSQAVRSSLGISESEFVLTMADIYELKSDVDRFMEQF